MKKFLKLSVLALLILAIAVVTVVGVSADTVSAPAKYDAAGEGIVSSYYGIDRTKGYITGIAPGTSVERLRNVCLPGNISASQETLATGTTVTATYTVEVQPEVTTDPTDTTADTTVPPEPVLETRTCSLTAVVTGDLNGDGGVTITDMLMIKSAVLGEQLSDMAAVAADINYDGSVTITDFLKVKANLLGLGGIAAGRAAGSSAGDPIILMTPGSSANWNSGVTAAAFSSSDGSVATVDAAGTVTSLSGEGSAFVYALDENGNVLARAMVTVLNEKLTVSLDASSHRLSTGQTVTLTPAFNHPVSPVVTWTSSDPAIVTVDGNGTVTAQGFGTATVTASLDNGSAAQTTVTVAPPITGMKFGKTLYKVKPSGSRTLDIAVTPADTGEEIVWTSSNTSVATVGSDGTVTGVSKGTVTITATGKYSGVSASCSVKVCDLKQVAITFDDGPSGYSTALLNFLKENNIQATFFIVGNRISSYPNTVKRIVNEGHEIGYHSFDHTLQSYLSSEQITSDFKKSNQMLKSLTGVEFTVWRAPGGDYSTRIMNCIPLPHIGWSVDTRDWETLNTDSVYSSILRNSKDGSIILLHDLYNSSVNGAIKAMKEMIAGDYEFLTVTELLSRNGTAPQKSTHYYRG